MAHNFTLNHKQSELKMQEGGYSLKNIRTSPLNDTPDDSLVRNLLNYSKAMIAVPNPVTGNFSFVLLN
ncbi:MAG TPA: hypothetical protein PLV51_11470 [Lentimicrobium sp.]|jgi:hypothetical protein|nr:hypothetical protein [Lentimicrobium sp.]